jgi:hypothetical protein
VRKGATWLKRLRTAETAAGTGSCSIL